MKSTLEREVKLQAGPRFEGVSLPGEAITERTLVSAYYDTDDLRLAKVASRCAAEPTPRGQVGS